MNIHIEHQIANVTVENTHNDYGQNENTVDVQTLMLR